MANIKELIQSIESTDSSFDEKLEAINKMEETLVALRQQEETAVQDNVDLIVEAIKVMENKVTAQLEVAKSIVPQKGDKGDKGDKGADGRQGIDGKNGQNGVDGKDGIDGKDGVSVSNAQIDFDGSLVITLSTGQEINVGEVVAPELQERIKLVTSGGAGTVLPSQTGNANKYLKTDGSALSWDALNGSDIDLSTPPTIGNTTPNTGSFTTLSASSTVSLTGTSNQISSVAVSSDPAAPSAGNLETFARTQIGFTTLAFENNTNAVAPFQTMMPFRKISMWNAGGSQSATAPAIFGFGALTVLGTNTSTVPASTNMITRTRRLNYISSAVAGNFAGHYEAASNIYLGSATTPAYSGFYFSVRFFIADTVASPRTFVGLSSTVTAPTNVQPSTIINCIGVGQGASDTNLFIYYGGSAAQTPIDLGVNFPTGTSNTDLYELNLFSPPTSNNTVYYAVKRLNTAHTATGTLTGTTGTVLPLNTQVISYRAWRTNNATATAVNVAIVGVYCETDF